MADNEALFTPELVFFDWECASPDEVFALLEDELAPRGYIAEGWLGAVRTREGAYPTGLAMPAANIAIPHTDPGFVAKPYIAVVKPAAPVTRMDFPSRVTVVFSIFMVFSLFSCCGRGHGCRPFRGRRRGRRRSGLRVCSGFLP